MDNPLPTTVGLRLAAYLNLAEDYRKQRRRINKQLIRLRHELGLVVKDTKNYLKKAKTKEITPEQYQQNNKYGLLLLLTAERDVLYAQELKLRLETADAHGDHKTLMVTKYRRAVAYCRQLLAIMVDDKVATLEVLVYLSLIEGQLAITKRQFAKAGYAFSVAKCGIDYLNSRDEADHGLFYEITDSIVDPSLNLALSKQGTDLGDLRAAARKNCRLKLILYLDGAVAIIESLDATFVADLSAQVDLIDSIEWRGHRATIYNEEVAFKIMGLQKLATTADLATVDGFDGLITGWSDVVEIHGQDTAKNQDDDDSENVQNRAVLLTFVKYNLLFTTLKRDLVLVDELETEGKVKECHRVFGQIILLVLEIEDLPGVYNDDELHSSLLALAKYFVAKQQETVADVYTKANQYAQALKVLAHVVEGLLVDERVYSVDFPFDISTNDQFTQYRQLVQTKLIQAQITAQITLLSRTGYIADNVQLFTPSTKDIVNILATPKVYPILSKPVLFDVGYNYISTPQGEEERAVEEENVNVVEEVELGKKGGLFGFFGRK